jgi:hypothetical protein
MTFGSSLNFGANLGFAHMHCNGCGETRLHRHCRCVSCHMLHSSGTYKPIEWSYHGGKNARARAAV